MSEVWQNWGCWDGENCPPPGLFVQEEVLSQTSPLESCPPCLSYPKAPSFVWTFSLCPCPFPPQEWGMAVALCSQASVFSNLLLGWGC